MHSTLNMPVDRRSLPVNWFENLIIYDLGMHTGQDTEFYLKKGFRVVAIEANSLLCDQARSKFHHQIETGRLTILNLGIADTQGTMEFHINTARSEWSSFEKSISGRDGSRLKTVTVEVATLASVISEYGAPYYIKIDIEGHDEYALLSVLNSCYKVPYISVENGGTMLNELHNNEYNAFKYIQQRHVVETVQNTPPLEGRYTSHPFEAGASGKFGEETDGMWLDYASMHKIISLVWDVESGGKNPAWVDSIGGWFDLHARHRNANAILHELIG